MLLRSSLQIKRHNRQHYWFNVSLIVQTTYLFLDGTQTLMMNRILASNEALVNFASLCLAITLNILSYTTLMFVAHKIELPLAEDKRQNRVVLGLPIAISMRGDREPEPVRLPQGDRLPVPAGLPLRGFHAADELRQFLGKAGDQLEDISLSDYYSQIDLVNVLSNPTHSQAEQNSSLGENIDVPMAIVEKDGDNISYFYFNHALKRILEATSSRWLRRLLRH